MPGKRIALLLFLVSASPFAQSPLPPDPRRILEDQAFLQYIYPRSEGSQAEATVLEYIEARLRQLRVPSSRFDFKESDLNHSFSTCLSASIRGELPDTLILAVPLNHPLDAPRDQDGSIDIALALSILEKLTRDRPPISVQVLFLGAEFGEEPDYPMGSRLFLRDFYPEYRVMTLYLNLRKIPTRLHVRAGGRRIESPYWLIDRTARALKQAGLFFLVRGNETQIFRVGLTSERTVIAPFLYAGYPAAALEGEYGELSEKEQENWVFSFSLFFDAFLRSFRTGIPETWDRHYLFFQARWFSFSISEKLYITILIAVIAGILVYSLVFTRRLRRYLRLLARDFWVLPLYLAFIFLLLFLSSWLIEGVLYVRNMTELWAELPLLFLAFKLAAPLLMFFSLLQLFRKVHIPRRGSFYSAAALLFLLLDIVVLAVVDISFTYYFLWAFVFALLFTATSNRLLKLAFFLASPYWILKTVVELFTLPALRFCRVVLLSKLWGNLLLAVILLPFILMFIRLRMVLPLFRITGRRTRQIVSACLFAVVLVGLLGIFLVYAPYGAGRAQPVTAQYTIDRESEESSLQFSSPAPLGQLHLWDGSELVSIDTRSRSYRVPLPDVGELLETSVSSVGFLDRQNINLTFRPRGAPYRMRLELSSPEEFVLYDANFPYQREPDGRRYSLLIGVNPPLPLSVQLTVPRQHSFTLGMTLEYRQPPAGHEFYGENKTIRTRLTYRTSLELKT